MQVSWSRGVLEPATGQVRCSKRSIGAYTLQEQVRRFLLALARPPPAGVRNIFTTKHSEQTTRRQSSPYKQRNLQRKPVITQEIRRGIRRRRNILGLSRQTQLLALRTGF